MNNLDLNEKNNLNNNSTDPFCNPIHFRCPSCSKLYTSDPFKIFVEHPEYTCSSCKTEFSISLLQALQSPEVLGVKIIKQVEPKTIDLPKEQIQDSLESKRVVESLQEEQLEEKAGEAPLKTSQEDLKATQIKSSLDSAWDFVLEDYEDRSAHIAFVKTCRDEGSLDTAIEKYTRLLKINPSDEIAKNFLAKIQIFEESKQLFTEEQKRRFFTKTFYITLAIVCLGLLFITYGLIFGDNKNLAGLGIGLIFFTFAVKAFFQPRRPNLG